MNRIKMVISEERDIVLSRQLVRQMASEMDFGIVDQTRLATAVSELTRNVLQYANSGNMKVQTVNQGGAKHGLKIVVSDKGPGIVDIKQAMTMGFTTSDGLGAGLPGIRQLMDEFDIHSTPGGGTTVAIVMWAW